MRILQVTATYYPERQFGGIPQKIHALSVGLTQRQHQVYVVTLRSTRRRGLPYFEMDGVRVYSLPWLGWSPVQIPLGWSSLRQLVDWSEIVHGYGLYNALVPLAAAAAHKFKRPFVLEPEGMYIPRVRKIGLKRLYHRLFTVPMSRQAAVVIATSELERRELSALVDGQRLVMRRNPLAFDNLATPFDGAAFRAKLRCNADEHLVLFIGRISPIKNLEMLIEAFQHLESTKARLVLVGPQLEMDYAMRLKSRIAALNLDTRVILTGPLYGQEKLSALAAADLFVLPSLSENFGIAAAEAVAAGIPVLLTETCGIAALINERAGLAVPPTIDGLVQGLRILLDDPARRAALTEQRAHVLADLSSDKTLGQIEQIYQTIRNQYVERFA